MSRSLAYCEAAFHERHVSVVQLVFAKPDWRGRLDDRPLTSVEQKI